MNTPLNSPNPDEVNSLRHLLQLLEKRLNDLERQLVDSSTETLESLENSKALLVECLNKLATVPTRAEFDQMKAEVSQIKALLRPIANTLSAQS